MGDGGMKKKIGYGQMAEEAAIHRIRITLTSTKVKALEKTCALLVTGAKQKSYVIQDLFVFQLKFFVFVYVSLPVEKELTLMIDLRCEYTNESLLYIVHQTLLNKLQRA